MTSRRSTVVLLAWSSAAFSHVLSEQRAVADPLGAGEGATYRLNDSISIFQRGCFPPCMCPVWEEHAVRGTMRLSYWGFDDGVHVYKVSDVNWMAVNADPELRITGSGTYEVGSPGPATVLQDRLQLDLHVGDGPLEHFDSGWAYAQGYPNIDITISIHGMVCFDTAIRAAASTVPDGEVARYRMLSGSTLQRGCFEPCDCLPPDGEHPVVGGFALVPLSNNSLFQEFAVTDLSWRVLPLNATSPQDVIPITGVGRYWVGGEFAAQHRLSLELAVGDLPNEHYDSGWAVGGTTFPQIDIVVSINNIYCYDTVIHAVAAPRDGEVCGGIAGVPCPAGQFCKYAMGQCCCDFHGVCQATPGACITLWDPVCGCDGVTYGNECEADRAGAAIAHFGECHGCEPTTSDACVKVVVDMDATTAGIQSNITVPAGTTLLRDVAVYIFDPSETHSMWGIGYLGGLDRGIAFGHSPDNVNHQGQVTGLVARPGAPVHPENTQFVFPAMDKGFAGPEIQYLEINASQPALIGANPAQPVFFVDVQLSGAQAGDVFAFHVLDHVRVWTGGAGGAFSTQGAMTLDTGGDAVPDATQTAYGTDPDAAIAAPPASFLVDFIDGDPAGPATITIVAGVVAGPGSIPTVSQWGLTAMSLLILAAGCVVLRRRAAL